MSNHWHSRYHGDYMRKTRHLSLCEHGAYTVLLDHYYSTAAPLPADEGSLFRLASAMLLPEQEAVQKVVQEFFVVGSDGMLHNVRADEEIAKQSEISQKRSQNGKKGADAKHKSHGKSGGKRGGKDGGKPVASANTTTTTVTTTDTTTTSPPPKAPQGAGDGPRTSFKQWTGAEFAEEIKAANHDGLLSSADCRDFYGYWTEQSASGRYKFALEKTWDTRRRMGTAKRLIYDKPAQGRPAPASNGSDYQVVT